MNKLALLVLSSLTFLAPPAARDWFVRSGSSGDGSRGAPFGDPWQALEKCEAGDKIHVAAGEYLGKFGTGTWRITLDRVELLGGYDPEFTARDPWKRPTKLCWDKASKNWPKEERLSASGKDVVVDGLVLDMQDQNEYQDEQKTGRSGKPGETALRFTQPATVRNCVVINPGSHAIDCVAGSRIENNLVVNAMTWGIVVTGAVTGVQKATATVRNNTVVFAWDLDKPGAGGYGGAAVALRGPATVTDNVLGWCDNAAIYAVAAPEHLAITGNVFWRNRFANLTSETGAQRAVVNDKSMELLEDIGLAACSGNQVVDPGLAFDATWLGYTGQREQEPQKPETPREEPRFGEPRRIEMQKGIAPACSLEQALALLVPKAEIKAGARAKALPAPSFAQPAGPGVARSYESKELTSWSKSPEAVDGKPIEMIVAIGGVANVSGMPGAYPRDQIAGVFLYDPSGSGERITGFYETGTTAERVCAGATGWYQGQGKPEKLWVVRGIAHATKSVPKAALFVESVERYEPKAAAQAPRPQGRDWFVKAGAAGGDGTREKPFRDPFQALERCEAGDTIHVAGGEYFGKLKAGRWTIGMPCIALLGGYAGDFSSRDPWKNPTRLYCPSDFQGRRLGYTIEGAGDHSGAIVDGFVFDKRTDNVYGKDGELDVQHSDKMEHLWLARPDCVVRNCLFLNGSCGAVRVASGQTFENNVFVNHVTQTVCVERGHVTAPFVFRGNTVLFAWTRRFGTGLGANGNLLRLCGGVRAVVEGNVFAHADNDAIRLECDPREVALRGNVFARNLWSNVQQMDGWHAFDDRNMAQLQGLGMLACEGNEAVTELALPVDRAWLAQHQATRGGARKEAKQPEPETARVRSNPFDAPTGGAPEPAAATRPGAAGGNPFDETPAAKDGAGAAELFAPAYDLQTALALFAGVGNAGARVRELPVAFTGVVRAEEQHEYAQTTWDVARRKDSWDKLAGQRVQLQVAIQRVDNQFTLPGIDAQGYASYMVSGSEGTDSGLPMRVYVKKGTRTQRVFDQAKGFATGKPLELHVVKGIVAAERQMIVEVAEK